MHHGRVHRARAQRPRLLEHVGTAPPSTAHAAPATFDARSEHRNAITAATSSSVPIRPSGGLGAGGVEHLVARLAGARRDLVRQPALGRPQLALDRAGRDGVHEHALAAKASANTRLSESCAAFVTE